MRKTILLAVVLTLFLLLPASITWAQTISSQKGLTTIIFPVKQGKITVYLPDDIRPGDHISGSIVLEPSGKTEKQKTEYFRVMLGFDLLMHQFVIPFEKIRIQPLKPLNFDWVVPADRSFKMPVELKQAGVQNNLRVIFEYKKMTGNSVSAGDCSIPSHVMTGNPLRITGPFDGNSSNTQCRLDSRELMVLAESPRQCVLQFPKDMNGQNALVVTDANGSRKICETNISGVNLEVSAGKLQLVKGEKTFIDVKISGLENLKDSVAVLSLTNKTTGTVKLLPADYIATPLKSATMPGGIFTARYDIQSLKSGGFVVDVNLDLPGNEENNPVYGFDLTDLKNESGYPGSYGNIGDQPCEPEGATIKWRWHKTFTCEIDDRKVLPCGHTKESSEILDKIKELLEDAELDKATDIAEKMSKAFSTAKTFSYSIHVIRKWVDYDIEYKCINGKWQPVGGVYIKHGTDDLGWHSVNHLLTKCWMTFDSMAAEKEFEAALEVALRNACK
jgi:hypothetical protein